MHSLEASRELLKLAATVAAHGAITDVLPDLDSKLFKIAEARRSSHQPVVWIVMIDCHLPGSDGQTSFYQTHFSWSEFEKGWPDSIVEVMASRAKSAIHDLEELLHKEKVRRIPGEMFTDEYEAAVKAEALQQEKMDESKV